MPRKTTREVTPTQINEKALKNKLLHFNFFQFRVGGGNPNVPFQFNYGHTLRQAPLLLTEHRLNLSVASTSLGHSENLAKSKVPKNAYPLILDEPGYFLGYPILDF